jgi:hypothetical protein
MIAALVMGKSNIKICAWNIRGCSTDNELFLTKITNYDIVTLNETHCNTEDHIVVKGYTCLQANRPRAKKATKDSGGVAVLIRESINAGVKLVHSPCPEYMWVKLDKKFFHLDKDIYMCCAYIPPRNSSYSLKLYKDILEQIESDVQNFSKINNIILLGDLNARVGITPDVILGDSDLHVPVPDSYIIDSNVAARRSQDKISAKGRGKDVIDLCISSSMRILNGRTFGDLTGKFTCHERLGSSVVDLAIVSEALVKEIPYFHVHEHLGTISDHSKISLMLKTNRDLFEQKADEKHYPTAQRYKWGDEIEAKYKTIFNGDDMGQKIKQYVEKNYQLSNAGIENATIDLTNLITSSAIKVQPRTNNVKRYTQSRKATKYQMRPKCKCETYELWQLKRNVNKKSIQLGRNPYDKMVRQNYFLALKKYRKANKYLKRKYQNDLVGKLNELNENNPKAYWQIIDQLRNATQLKSENSEKISLGDWKNYFDNLNQSNVHQEKNQAMASKCTELESQNIFNELNFKIETSELTKAINSLKNGKSSGVDGIRAEMIKSVSSKLVPLLKKLFNLIFTGSIYPNMWSKGIITPIYKKENPMDPSNYRGITVMNCIAKLFNSILNNRLVMFMEHKKLLSKSQIGFKKNARTADHIFVLKTLINKYVKNKGKLYACFVDFQKAFDTVWHNGMLFKIQKMGVGGYFYKIIKAMYKDINLCVKSKKLFITLVQVIHRNKARGQFKSQPI